MFTPEDSHVFHYKDLIMEEAGSKQQRVVGGVIQERMHWRTKAWCVPVRSSVINTTGTFLLNKLRNKVLPAVDLVQEQPTLSSTQSGTWT